MLVTYEGTKDSNYPARLAERVQALLGHPELLDQRNISVAIARQHFDYDVLARRVGQTVRWVLQPTGDPGPALADEDSVQPGTSRGQSRF
jgi:hypothetical protein